MRVAAVEVASEDELIDRLATAVIELDAAGRVVTANPAALALFGAERLARPSLGVSWAALLAAADKPATWEGASAAAEDVRVGVQRTTDGWLVEARRAEARPSAGDALTGLADRRLFGERLSAKCAEVRRGGAPFAVLGLDLDRFKMVNDTLGHDVGDRLLCKVAERLSRACREEDLVARLGGDEFAVLQVGGDPQSAETLAARLVDLLSRTYMVGGHTLNVGASVGVAMAPADGASPEALLRHADLALYRAKADGRGAFRFFEPAMNERMQARRSLEVDLRRALALREFELAYQPQVESMSGRITGFEALLRWRHPERGLVSPADFIPVAEEIGLIARIGEWALRAACAEAAGWPDDISIAVNLSPVQVRGGRLTETIGSALASSGLPPSRLELEITEGVLLVDTDLVLSELKRVRALGVRISMDDFGTGYSSLSYLQKFPFSKIKIDQSFIRQLEHDPDASAIVRAVVALGSSLGMRTTAEGEETEGQRAEIRNQGCTEIQGYLTGRPMPAADAGRLIDAQLRRPPA